MKVLVRFALAILWLGSVTDSPLAHAGATITIGSGFNNPSGIAVDASGNVFVADTDNSEVKELLAPGYTTINTLGSGFRYPRGVAVDASGNVFVADTGNNAVKEILAPAYTTINTLGSIFGSPVDVAVDASGNLFVAEQGPGRDEVEELWAPSYTNYFFFFFEFMDPSGLPISLQGVAVDASGNNVFVADSNNSAVMELMPPDYMRINTLGSGFINPSGVAVDASGNVFVADFGNNAVKEILAPGYTTVNTLGSGFFRPSGVAVDAGGNVFVSDSGNNAVKEILAAMPPTIAKVFGAATVALNGSTSLTFNISNPNTSATLTGVAFTDNLPAGMVVATPNGLTNNCGGTATAVASSSVVSLSAGTLAASASCTVAVNVQGTTVSVKNNSVQVTSTNGSTGNTSNASLTITQATPTVTATGGTFTYNGNPHAGSATATGGAGESLTIASLAYNGTGSTTYGPSSTAPSLAGTYTVTAHTNGDANNTAGDSTPTALTITKFNPLMAAFGGTFTYNGSPRAGSGQALGGAGEALPVTLSYQGISGTIYGPSATPPTNVGVYLVTAHTVGDANNNAEDSLPNALRINKATATVAVNEYCVPYDGSPHTASGTATGVISESLTSGLDLTATTHTAASEYLADAWNFNGSPNYNDANGTVNDSIVNAVIIAPTSAAAGSTGNTTSVASAGAGATYSWSITNGTITAGSGTASIAFTAGAVGTLTLNVTVTNSLSCSASKSANVTVSSMADLTLTLADNHSNTMIGNSVNYIIEVANPTGPSQIAATVTDTLPAGLGNGSWTCIAFGGAMCASGNGNALSDAVTLPVGSEAAYVYSATVISADATDQLTNAASVAVAAGSSDPNAANNSATDTDIVHIFIDGFEGTPLMRPNNIGNGADHVTTTVRVDANLLSGLSLSPTAVAVGRGTDGKELFTLELARFGNDYVLRTIVKDADGRSERTSWQTADMSIRLISFDWQSAATNTAGYFSVNGGGAALSVSPHDDQDRLTGLSVTVENNVPWLVLIAH